MKWPKKESTQAFFKLLVIPLLPALRLVLELEVSESF